MLKNKYRVDMLDGMGVYAETMQEAKKIYRKAIALGMRVVSVKRYYKNGLVGEVLPYICLVA